MEAPTNSTSNAEAASKSIDDGPIITKSPPWTLTGDFYTLCSYITASQAANFPSVAYSPLEAASDFADPTLSRPVGGICMIQIIRYRQSPVGPYDELAIIPGKFEWSRESPDGERITSQDYKISRIYVSQKHTCYSGRSNWNIPKHLAKFDWTPNPDGSVTVSVYPHDTTSDQTEADPSSNAFFRATIKAVPYIPTFPFSTKWLTVFGMNTRAVFPPLPAGKGSHGELPGTDHWRMITPVISGNKSVLVTINMSQRDENGSLTGEHDNFWPGFSKWHVGVKMENAEMAIGEPDDTW